MASSSEQGYPWRRTIGLWRMMNGTVWGYYSIQSLSPLCVSLSAHKRKEEAQRQRYLSLSFNIIKSYFKRHDRKRSIRLGLSSWKCSFTRLDCFQHSKRHNYDQKRINTFVCPALDRCSMERQLHPTLTSNWTKETLLSLIQRRHTKAKH